MMDLKGKKVLVTGGAGFLGPFIVAGLEARGAAREDIVVPRSETDDVRDMGVCRRLAKGKDVVIHAAGVTGDTEFHRAHPAEIFSSNLLMGVQLMEASREAGVSKFVTIGSALEYPEHTPLPFREDDLWIGMPERFHLPYATAKKMLSVQASAYRAQYGFNAVHLLMTNMYGPGREVMRGYVVTNVIRRILEAEAKGKNFIEMWGTGNSTRDFIYVADAAEGVLLATEKYDSSEPVNLGSGWEISMKELATTIARLMHFEGEIKWDATKSDGIPRRMLNPTRATRAFGFNASTPFEEGLAATIAWHRENFSHS